MISWSLASVNADLSYKASGHEVPYKYSMLYTQTTDWLIASLSHDNIYHGY